MRTGNASNGFLAGKIGNMDKSVVETSVEVGNTEHKFALSNLGTERHGSLLFGRLSLLWCLRVGSCVSIVLYVLMSIQPENHHPAFLHAKCSSVVPRIGLHIQFNTYILTITKICLTEVALRAVLSASTTRAVNKIASEHPGLDYVMLRLNFHFESTIYLVFTLVLVIQCLSSYLQFGHTVCAPHNILSHYYL